MRHGLDADHLAAIDGLTRFNAQSQPRLARLCGALFALGHGVLVIIVALAVGSLISGGCPEYSKTRERASRSLTCCSSALSMSLQSCAHCAGPDGADSRS